MKKQVLHINKTQIRHDNVQGEKQETVLNNFISNVETEVKNSFSDEEKVRLKENAEGFLKEWIKQFYQFPNATDEFNVQALGVNLKGLASQFRAKSKEWNKYPYKLSEGQFKLDIEAIQEKYTRYTSNEFQNDALELANDLIKLVDRGIEKGIINTDAQTSIKIAEAFRVLALDSGYYPEKFHNLVPNPGIKSIPKIIHNKNMQEKLEALAQKQE